MQAEFDVLSLEAMLQLKSHADTKIAAAEQAAPTGARSIELWLRKARTRRDHMLQPAIDDRVQAVVRPAIFWLVVDKAMARLGGDDTAILARVAPVLWRSVRGKELSTSEQIRTGYLTASQVTSIVGAGTKFFGDENIVKHLHSGASVMSNRFILKDKSATPTDAGAALATTVESIHDQFEKALTQIFRETGEVVFGPPKALRASLAQQAKKQPRSILSLMGIENRTPAQDQHLEVEAAMREIAIISGVATGSSALLEAESQGKYFAVKVLATRSDGHPYVHYVGYGTDWDEWIDPARLRTRTKLRENDQAWITWEGGVYPTKILEVGEGKRAGQIRVHWLGFSERNDHNWIDASLFAGRGGA